MQNQIEFYRLIQGKSLVRPLISTLVPAGFPTPAENYIEGRIDLNKELIRHPLATFYVRVSGDSMMNIGIYDNSWLVVDRAEEVLDGHIIIARIGDDFCVKRICFEDDGSITLLSENDFYAPILIKNEDDFEVWGKVVCTIQRF